EDGIRDRNVTGVQTCALPIFIKYIELFIWLFTQSVTAIVLLNSSDTVFSLSTNSLLVSFGSCSINPSSSTFTFASLFGLNLNSRSEERRVGKECRFL